MMGRGAAEQRLGADTQDAPLDEASERHSSGWSPSDMERTTSATVLMG